VQVKRRIRTVGFKTTENKTRKTPNAAVRLAFLHRRGTEVKLLSITKQGRGTILF